MMMNELKESLQQSYDKETKSRDRLDVQDWKVIEREKFLELLMLENKKNLLEIGAGTGRDSLYFNDKGFSVKTIDLSSAMVALCREKGLDAETMSFDQLDFPSDTFDGIWALNCLLHVPKKELASVLNGIKRVLKPGGIFFMGVYGGVESEGVWEGDHYEPKRFFSFFTDEALKETVSSIFTIERFHSVPPEEVGGSLSFQSLTLRK